MLTASLSVIVLAVDCFNIKIGVIHMVDAINAKREMRANQFSSVLGALYGEPEDKRRDITGGVGRLLTSIEDLLDRAKRINEELQQIENCGAQLPGKLARLSFVLDQLEKVDDDLPIEVKKTVVIATENLPKFFSTKVSDLEFETRVVNCLRVMDIYTIGDLVQREELHSPNFGRKSRNQVIEFLQSKNLRLGMTPEEIGQYIPTPEN